MAAMLRPLTRTTKPSLVMATTPRTPAMASASCVPQKRLRSRSPSLDSEAAATNTRREPFPNTPNITALKAAMTHPPTRRATIDELRPNIQIRLNEDEPAINYVILGLGAAEGSHIEDFCEHILDCMLCKHTIARFDQPFVQEAKELHERHLEERRRDREHTARVGLLIRNNRRAQGRASDDEGRVIITDSSETSDTESISKLSRTRYGIRTPLSPDGMSISSLVEHSTSEDTRSICEDGIRSPRMMSEDGFDSDRWQPASPRIKPRPGYITLGSRLVERPTSISQRQDEDADHEDAAALSTPRAMRYERVAVAMRAFKPSKFTPPESSDDENEQDRPATPRSPRYGRLLPRDGFLAQRSFSPAGYASSPSSNAGYLSSSSSDEFDASVSPRPRFCRVLAGIYLDRIDKASVTNNNEPLVAQAPRPKKTMILTAGTVPLNEYVVEDERLSKEDFEIVYVDSVDQVHSNEMFYDEGTPEGKRREAELCFLDVCLILVFLALILALGFWAGYVVRGFLA